MTPTKANGRLILTLVRIQLDALRAQFQSHGLHEHEVDADPGLQFGRWLTEARDAGVHEPEAMVVSTATAAGQPSSRHVLVRDWSDGALTFFTNYESQKGKQIAENPEVAADRGELEARVAEVEARFDGIDVPRPPYWGGYRIVVAEWEFWQGRPSRLHDRIRYRRDPVAEGGRTGRTDGWIIERLSP